MNDTGNLDKHSDTQSSASTANGLLYLWGEYKTYALTRNEFYKSSWEGFIKWLAEGTEHNSADPDANTDSHKVAQS